MALALPALCNVFEGKQKNAFPIELGLDRRRQYPNDLSIQPPDGQLAVAHRTLVTDFLDQRFACPRINPALGHGQVDEVAFVAAEQFACRRIGIEHRGGLRLGHHRRRWQILDHVAEAALLLRQRLGAFFGTPLQRAVERAQFGGRLQAPALQGTCKEDAAGHGDAPQFSADDGLVQGDQCVRAETSQRGTQRQYEGDGQQQVGDPQVQAENGPDGGEDDQAHQPEAQGRADVRDDEDHSPDGDGGEEDG
ncbi:hypothetical protein GALL_519670 [mine drainage metagenome]|uniref:Uncharacterized protein n=1 Tax=mine drainage metagenome TaxID=410659 RepID=A0A1J5PFY8_9ZZZZ